MLDWSRVIEHGWGIACPFHLKMRMVHDSARGSARVSQEYYTATGSQDAYTEAGWAGYLKLSLKDLLFNDGYSHS